MLLIDSFVLHSRSNPDDKSRPCEYPSGFALVHSSTYYRVGRRQLGAIAISIKTTLTRRHTQVCHISGHVWADVIWRIETRHDWQQQQRWKMDSQDSVCSAQMNIIVVQSKPHSFLLLAGVFFCLLHTQQPTGRKRIILRSIICSWIRDILIDLPYIFPRSSWDSGSVGTTYCLISQHKSRWKLLIYLLKSLRAKSYSQ